MNRRGALLLAWSPWFCLVGGPLLASAVLYVTLWLFIRSKQQKMLETPPLLLAAMSTSLLVVTAILFCLAPYWWLQPEPSSATGVTLTALPEDGASVSGLNFRSDPVLRKSPEGQFSLGIQMRQGAEKSGPPFHFEDGFGDSVDFTQTGPSSVRLIDNRGGFADIDWEGTRFKLITSRSAGKSRAARGPTASAVQLADWGFTLALVTPLLSWLILTVYLRQEQRLRSGWAAWATASMVLQALGILSSLWLLIGKPWLQIFRPGQSDAQAEQQLATLAILAVAWLTCSGLGLAIFTREFIRESDRAELRELVMPSGE